MFLCKLLSLAECISGNLDHCLKSRLHLELSLASLTQSLVDRVLLTNQSQSLRLLPLIHRLPVTRVRLQSNYETVPSRIGRGRSDYANQHWAMVEVCFGRGLTFRVVYMVSSSPPATA